MTNEEAINIIKSECYIFNPLNFDRSTMINTALDKAIETLEQESDEDAVSRASVFETLGNLMSIPYDFDRQITEKDVSESMDEIKNLPSVTPARKKGKWIGHGEHCENLGVIPSGLGAYEWCSNCDCGIDVREWHRNHYNYCPNCGCRMEREE